MRYSLSLLVLITLFLTACSAATSNTSIAPTPDRSATLSAIVSATFSAMEVNSPPATEFPVPSATPTTDATSIPLPPEEGLTRTDEQGAVVVDVTPMNLTNPAETINIEVGMNTHSVDLSMDLTKLAMLKTDTGLSAAPISWDGGAGGHHVSGKLAFPTQVDGKSFLAGASVLTLVIQNVDAPERTFTWNLTQ